MQKMGELIGEIMVELDLPALEGLLERLSWPGENGPPLGFKRVGQAGSLVQWQAGSLGYLTALPLKERLSLRFYRLEADVRRPVRKIVDAEGKVWVTPGYHPGIESWELAPPRFEGATETEWVAAEEIYFAMGPIPWQMIDRLTEVFDRYGIRYGAGLAAGGAADMTAKPASDKDRPAAMDTQPAISRSKPEPPEPGTDYNQWFDWYHAMKKSGYKMTLKELAGAMALSYSYVRRLHSLYRQEWE